MRTEYIVMTASAKMPSSCWGHYGKVALCEVEEGHVPAMISERAKGMVRIVVHRDRLNMGGEHSAFAVAKRELEELCERLNAREPEAYLDHFPWPLQHAWRNEP